MNLIVKSIVLGLLLAAPTLARADVVTEFTSAFRTGTDSFASGQGFTVPAGTAFDDLTFNFLLGPQRHRARRERYGVPARSALYRPARLI